MYSGRQLVSFKNQSCAASIVQAHSSWMPSAELSPREDVASIKKLAIYLVLFLLEGLVIKVKCTWPWSV